MHFDLQDLVLFVHIAELENLTRGAARASLSPPAASSRLKSLEHRLDNQLFYRDRRGLKLTPAGQTLLRHARVILRQMEELKDDVAGHGDEVIGHMRIFANTTAITEVLPGVLMQFMGSHPHVTVDIQEKTTREVVRGMLDIAADLGVIAGPASTSGLTALHFSTDRLILVTPENHPLSNRNAINFDECLQYHHVGLQSSTLHSFLNETVERFGKKLQLRVSMTSYEAMCRMIEAGVGIGVIPESTAARHGKSMRLATVRLNDPWSIRERRVLLRDYETLPRGARIFLDLLMESRPPIAE